MKNHNRAGCNVIEKQDGCMLPVKNHNRVGCNVLETISVLKFPQIQGSLQHARKVVLDEVAYENAA